MQSPPLTLTTSESIARALRSEHALAQRRAGLSAWQAPAIHSIRGWCRDQWLQSWPTGQLLHPVQEFALWLRVISDDEAARDVLGLSALARQARSTSHVVAQYGIDPQRGPRYTDEQRAYARWHTRVLLELRDRDWIRELDIPVRVAALLRDGRIAAPPSVRVCGAYRPLPPMEMALLDSLKDAGAKVLIEHTPPPRASLEAIAYEDETQQFRGLASRLRELLLPFADSDEPPPQILVACPDVAMRRELLEATLRPVLAPWLVVPGEGIRPVPWRFSTGRGLDNAPVVAVALAICGLTLHDNRMDDLSRVLLASVLWAPQERSLTAAVDHALRREGGNRFALTAAVAKIPVPLKPRFDALERAVGAAPKRALPSAWAAHFEQRLDGLGWPGHRSLTSPEFQARERWMESLISLRAMDDQLGVIDHAGATYWLHEIVSNQPFVPRSDTLQPIQILSLPEAAGLPADHLFVVDATDDAIPDTHQRLPFVAIETLKSAGVPAVTPALALEDGVRLAQHLRGTAAAISLSFARNAAQGAQKTPTAVFGADLPWQSAPARQALTAAERTAQAGPRTSTPATDPVPPVDDPATEGVAGGATIFKNYLDAPFFAFCIHRLGIQPLPEPGPGLTALVQGVVLHDVLESLWRELQTRKALNALDDDALGERVDAPLDRAMARYLPSDRYGRRLRAIERARLRDVLLQWLRHEGRRHEDFEAIAFERKVPLNIEGLALNLRIDRVDRVFTGAGERLLIIDYKTGRSVDIGGWEVDELTEPQLPLYACSAALDAAGLSRVDGIAFAHLRDGHPAMAAATNWRLRLLDDEKLKVIENWPAQLDSWRERLMEIARGFLRGEAGIDLSRARERGFNADLLDLIRQDP